EFRQDIHADVVRLERVRVLLEIVPAQHLDTLSDAVKSRGRAGAPAARNTSAGAHRLARSEPRLACLRVIPATCRAAANDRPARAATTRKNPSLSVWPQKLPIKPARKLPTKLVASQTPIIIDRMRPGATLVTSDSPTGER